MYAGSVLWRDLLLRGRQASLVWGYRPAATLTHWTITRKDERDGEPRVWQLVGTLGANASEFALRQRPLLLTVGHKLGFWTFPVQRLIVAESRVIATLGPPEQG